jgi:hypothetical protein
VQNLVSLREERQCRIYKLKRNPTTMTCYGTEMKSEAGPSPRNTPTTPLSDTRVYVTQIARPLLKPVAQNLCSSEHRAERVFTIEHHFASKLFVTIRKSLTIRLQI